MVKLLLTQLSPIVCACIPCVQIRTVALDTVVEDVRNISDRVLQAIQTSSPIVQDTELGECCRCVGEGGREGEGTNSCHWCLFLLRCTCVHDVEHCVGSVDKPLVSRGWDVCLCIPLP